jgi:hypothetical protein
MRIVVASAFIMSCVFARAQQPHDGFPLLGLWRTVSAVTRDGRDITPRDGAMELDFLPDNTVAETVLAPSKTGDQPVRIRYGYTFQPPDILNYTYKRGDHIYTQHQRIRLTGDVARLENLDSGIVSTIRRIGKSEFKAPKDLPALPE